MPVARFICLSLLVLGCHPETRHAVSVFSVFFHVAAARVSLSEQPGEPASSAACPPRAALRLLTALLFSADSADGGDELRPARFLGLCPGPFSRFAGPRGLPFSGFSTGDLLLAAGRSSPKLTFISVVLR